MTIPVKQKKKSPPTGNGPEIQESSLRDEYNQIISGNLNTSEES